MPPLRRSADGRCLRDPMFSWPGSIGLSAGNCCSARAGGAPPSPRSRSKRHRTLASGAVHGRRYRNARCAARRSTISWIGILTARSNARAGGRWRAGGSAPGPAGSLPDRALAHRPRGSALLQPLHGRARCRGLGPGRRLPLHEADHQLAAVRARSRLRLGGAGRLVRHGRQPRLAAAGALCRRHPVDDGLRHDLRAPGHRRRCRRRHRLDRDPVRPAREGRCGRRCMGWRWSPAGPLWSASGQGHGLGSASRAFGLHLASQVLRIRADDPRLARDLFHSNRNAGLLLFAGLAIQAWVSADRLF